jgi:hypothetical protein
MNNRTTTTTATDWNTIAASAQADHAARARNMTDGNLRNAVEAMRGNDDNPARIGAQLAYAEETARRNR